MAKLNIANWIDCTEVEGPGKRFAVWVQGCFRRCPECCNPYFFDFVPKMIIQAADLCNEIEKSLHLYDIEGITLLGGEPVLQAKGLAEVAEWCQRNGLSVMLFTGYRYDNLLQENLQGVNDLLRYTDIVVDGEYDATRKETVRNWVGSHNQRFYFLTDRYNEDIVTDAKFVHGFELRLRNDGTLISNGFPMEWKL
jgi:anaerobic ribonucleoside-triphosphate reductase activating protein